MEGKCARSGSGQDRWAILGTIIKKGFSEGMTCKDSQVRTGGERILGRRNITEN